MFSEEVMFSQIPHIAENCYNGFVELWTARRRKIGCQQV